MRGGECGRRRWLCGLSEALTGRGPDPADGPGDARHLLVLAVIYVARLRLTVALVAMALGERPWQLFPVTSVGLHS